MRASRYPTRQRARSVAGLARASLAAVGNAKPPDGDLRPNTSHSRRFMTMVLGQATLQLVTVLMMSSNSVGERNRRPRPDFFQRGSAR